MTKARAGWPRRGGLRIRKLVTSRGELSHDPSPLFQEARDVPGIEDHLSPTHVSHLCGLEFERGCDSEKRAGASYRPEEIRVFPIARAHHRAVRKDQLDRAQAVNRQPVGSSEQADTTSGCQAPNSDGSAIARAQRPSKRSQSGGDVHPTGTRLDANQSDGWVEDFDLRHSG